MVTFTKEGKRISKNEAIQKIVQSKGKFFRVVFIKRTTGEIRSMLCRIGVKKYLKGGKLRFNAIDRNLLNVYDVTKKGYRFINLDSIQSVRIGGTEYGIK